MTHKRARSDADSINDAIVEELVLVTPSKRLRLADGSAVVTIPLQANIGVLPAALHGKYAMDTEAPLLQPLTTALPTSLVSPQTSHSYSTDAAVDSHVATSLAPPDASSSASFLFSPLTALWCDDASQSFHDSVPLGESFLLMGEDRTTFIGLLRSPRPTRATIPDVPPSSFPADPEKCVTSLEHDVQEEFKCVICYSFPPDHMLQCNLGHVFCGDCWRGMQKAHRLADAPIRCPTCRLPLGCKPARNRLGETVLASLPVACTNTSCIERPKFQHLKTHVETTCHFRHVSCRYQAL
jgi:hypothetical protein